MSIGFERIVSIGVEIVCLLVLRESFLLVSI